MSEEIVLSSGKGGWAWIFLAGFLGLGAIWGGDWFLNCYGPQGEIHYQNSWNSIDGSPYDQRPLNFLRGHNTGLMWLQQGQQVDISYQAGFARKKEFAFIWFGSLDEWLHHKYVQIGGFIKSKGLRLVREGTGSPGSYTFQARKSGLHVVYIKTLSIFNGEVTVSWKAR